MKKERGIRVLTVGTGFIGKSSLTEPQHSSIGKHINNNVLPLFKGTVVPEEGDISISKLKDIADKILNKNVPIENFNEFFIELPKNQYIVFDSIVNDILDNKLNNLNLIEPEPFILTRPYKDKASYYKDKGSKFHK